MLQEVLNYIVPRDNETYLDCTFGGGGYSKALLDAANCNLYAIDCDPDAGPRALALQEQYQNRFKFILERFGNLEHLGINRLDAIIFDLGVSSMQLDQGDRGFSFMQDAELDMRMSKSGETAGDFINRAAEEELADVIFHFGGERCARKIAKAIVAIRKNKPITRTLDFANIVRRIVGYSKNSKIDPATRTFQAIRIKVNNELGELQTALEAAEKILALNGRLVIVTFHSLEDKIVKEFMMKKSGKVSGVSRHMPLPELKNNEISLEIITKKAMSPSEQEVRNNPRARSAKLRAARKII
jgi:16S rRNA (cytosine1402-N4)-methyltransferase